MSLSNTQSLERVYGSDAPRAEERFSRLSTRFAELYGAGEPQYFSAPGRTEIVGNHTDHNGGKILAASITMDTIGAAAPSGNDVVTIVSEGYPDPIVVDLAHLSDAPHLQGTTSLVAGMADAVRQRGYVVGGFNAVVSTEVIPSAGVSSSASFEMLVCTIIDRLFNGDAIPKEDYARIGQYAENVWWEKASGLMDQMACAVGGTILLDFSDGVHVEPVDFSFDELGYDLVIVNTGKGHADLSAEYSSIPDEMHAVAKALGVRNLCETSEQALMDVLPQLRAELGDRAVMRALHFFEECGRVTDAAAAIAAGDKTRMLEIIRESGNSSWKWLQNAYVTGAVEGEPIPVALAMTELFLKRIGDGVCRLHGGGFAGVIMCVVPQAKTAEYVEYMERVFGAGNAYRTNIRQAGAICLG